MMPKIIHCCWLSGEPKTELSEKCRASWKKFAPDYEIREWTGEGLAGLGEAPAFVKEALKTRKWAFAADWVRFAALHREGGVYFDYDFELVAPIDDVMAEGAFVAGQWMPDGSVGMEPAVLALEKGSPIAASMLDRYETEEFDGKTTVGELLGGVVKHGGTLRVLPPEVLSPIRVDGSMHRTEKTVGIHWYAMSWASPKRKVLQWLSWHGFRWAIDLALKVKRSMPR